MSAQRRAQMPWRSVLLWGTLVLAAGGIAVTARAAIAPAGTPGVAGPAVVAQADAGRTAPDAGVPGPDAAAAGRALPAAQQAPPRPATQSTAGCQNCHGELELLRQQTGSLSRAQQVLVPAHVVAASAHGDMTCAECHSGYARYPHEERGTRTESCVSCHAAADTLWRKSTHASADEQVTCAQCHTSHDIKPAELLRSKAGAAVANAPCLNCHQTEALPAHAPHADSVSCASCHAPHDTRPVDDPESWLAPARQMQTCAACHEEVADKWRSDIHGDAALREAHLAGREPLAETVVCTSCHAGHGMLARDDPGFMLQSVERCSECHQDAARTFYNSYHGRATALGSRVSAACHQCHSAHEVLPDTFPASHVARANLVATCGECHANARPAFVLYDSHPDPFNRARNPWLFYSFFMMNGLLVFVLIVFGGHTLLWWLRLWLDKRRGIIHGIGVHGHGHGSGGAHGGGHGQEEGGHA